LSLNLGLTKLGSTDLVLTNVVLTRGHGSLFLDPSFTGHICYTRISGLGTFVPRSFPAGIKSSVKLH
jgi:hypothetical protein